MKASNSSTTRKKVGRSAKSAHSGAKPHANKHAAPATSHKNFSSASLGAYYSAGAAVSLSSNLQAKFTIGQADDPYEREADLAADHVMRGRPVPAITPVPAAGLASVAKMPDGEDEESEQQSHTPQAKNVQREQSAQDEESDSIDQPDTEQQAQAQTESEQGESEQSEEQPKLLQCETQSDEEEPAEAQTRLLQKQQENDTDEETEKQPMMIQRMCAECEKEAREENRSAQPLLVQRQASRESDTEEEPEKQTPQPRLLQRETETESENEEEPPAASPQPRLLQRQIEADIETEPEPEPEPEAEEQPLQPRLIQRRVEFPSVPNAEKELAETAPAAEKAPAEEAPAAEEAGAEAGAGKEGEGIDPPLEPYQPVEIPPPVQTKRRTGQDNARLERQLTETGSSGSPLEAPVRMDMERHFQHDLSVVRIHTDANAAQMNKNLRAHAFTQGNNIYFNAGQYQPQTDFGKRLLSHELAHTVQQGSAGNTLQRFEAPEQGVATDPPAVRPNDGSEVTGRMNRKIDEETEERDPEDMDEEERRAARNPDRGEVRRDSSSLNNSGQSRPSVDRGAAAQEKTAAQREQIDQQVSEPTPEGTEASTEEGEEAAPPSDAEAAAQRAEEAEASAQNVPIPDRPQPFRHPRMDAPVDSAGEPLPRQPNMDMRVRGLGYIGEMLREKGYEMKRAAAENVVGSYGQDAALERLRGDLANAVEGTGLMQNHNEERKTILEQSRLAHQESVERQQFVAQKAPDLAAKADEGKGDSSALAADSRSKAEQAESELPEDPDARADAEQQNGELQDSSQGAASMDQAITQTGQRARQYEQDAAQAAEQNQQSEAQIDETENTITETDTRLEEMTAANEASNEQIENAGPGPELIRANSERTAQSGDQLIAATTVMEQELNALQEEYLASARVLESREEAEERIREEQERQASAPQMTPVQSRLIELGNATPEQQQSIIEDMDQEERDELITEIDNQPTQEEAEAQQLAQSQTATSEPDANADPRAPQIAEIDNRRSQRVDGVLNIADQNMSLLTAEQQQMIANQVVAESVSDSIRNINVLQMARQMIEGMINPMMSIQSTVDGFKKIGGGLGAAFSAEAWAADPLGNLLKVAADISTGLAMVFSSVLGIAAIITALMVVLTILSWGTLSPVTGPVIGWMGTVMTYAGWGAIISGGLAVYFNYLSYIKNLSDAGTATTARELFENADEMKQNATDGFTGAMAVVEGIGAVKMGPRLSSGEHFARVPRSPGEAIGRVGTGIRRAGAGLAAMPGRIARGVSDLFNGGRQALLRLRERLRSIARRGERPPTQADIPSDVPVRTPRDGNLGTVDGQRVRAEVDLPGNQRMRVLEDGSCVVCSSPCRQISLNYADELANNPRLAMRLERIERSLARNPNQPRVIQAADDIRVRLADERAARPRQLRSEFDAELKANEGLARQLNELEPRIAAKPANRRLQRRINAIERQLDTAKRNRLRAEFADELAHNPHLARQLDELPPGQSSRRQVRDVQEELRGTRADRATAREIRDIMRSPEMAQARRSFLRRGSHRRARQRAWDEYRRNHPDPATRPLSRDQYFRAYDTLRWNNMKGGIAETLLTQRRAGIPQRYRSGRWPRPPGQVGPRWGRYIDLESRRFIRELKSGRLRNTRATRTQIIKDLMISRKTGLRPVWILLEGADPSILRMLNRHGFRVIIPR